MVDGGVIDLRAAARFVMAKRNFARRFGLKALQRTVSGRVKFESIFGVKER